MLDKAPYIIAHRGFSAISPENTVRAVVDAVKGGADLVEVDVQLTKDGSVVVMHDNTVDRTTNGTGAVAELTLNEVKSLDAGTWKGKQFAGEKVPTLDELLDLFVKEKYEAKLLIELKFDIFSRKGFMTPIEGLAEKVAALVEERNAVDHVVVQSFVKAYLLRILELNKRIAVSHLLLPWSGLSDSPFFSANPNYRFMSQSLVDRAHERGQKVMTWTVDKREEMLTCMAMGVDGIITNEPLRLKHLVETIEPYELSQFVVKSSLMDHASVVIALFLIIIAYFWFSR